MGSCLRGGCKDKMKNIKANVMKPKETTMCMGCFLDATKGKPKKCNGK